MIVSIDFELFVYTEYVANNCRNACIEHYTLKVRQKPTDLQPHA